MTREAALALICDYYDACSRADVDGIVATLDEDVIHYFLMPNLGSTPVDGAEHLARYWRKVGRAIRPTWVVDSIVTEGDSAVIEWTMFWNPDEAADRIATRGSEWFRFKEGRIVEIRSYYQQRPQTTELDSFPYESRGYSVLGRESSAIHRGPGF